MKRGEAIARLLRDVLSDVADYGALRLLLDSQFHAALRHDATALRALAARITEAVQVLDGRRLLRARVVNSLYGVSGRMDSVFDELPEDSRERCRAMWTRLEALVVECKRLNARNCLLMTDQYEIMQRVLHGEDQTYAPA